jgi:glycerol kinase
MKYILAIDQGTSSTKAIVFDISGNLIARGVAALQTTFFEDGRVEQDPEAIIQNVIEAVSSCLAVFTKNGGDLSNIVSIGISNQRETFVLWDEEGKPLHHAIVWQCKRSVDICATMIEKGLSSEVSGRTGLIIDPYFSGTKVRWLYQHNDKARQAIDNGKAYFGTIDTWLLFRFTGGKKYCTDHTNASRTLFMNLTDLTWDQEMLQLLGLQGLQLPTIHSSGADYGSTDLMGCLPKAIPISAMIGDSHAAAFGECCFVPGTAKATMGTGCSVLMNIGIQHHASLNGMVNTVCWSKGDVLHYAMEGVIVSCGATLDWMKNEMRLFEDSGDTASMAESVADNGGIYLVPAFSGLGAPHWDMNRRASISGMGFGTKREHLVRAALESIVYQIKDVVVAMEKDAGIDLQQLMVDGGIAKNEFVLRWLTNVLCRPVATLGQSDVSALGAAMMAAWQDGLVSLEQLNVLHDNSTAFSPIVDPLAEKGYQGWLSTIHQ